MNRMMPTVPKYGRHLPLLALLTLLQACAGGFHEKGEKRWSVRAVYGEPIDNGGFFGWNTAGDARNFGVGAANYWYFHDRLAAGIGLTPLYFSQAEGDSWGAETEAHLRWHMFEAGPVGFLMDANCGYLWAQSPIPTGGTRSNFSYGVGPGLEVPLSKGFSVLGGFQFHHISNGKGLDSPANPSQNELRMWFALTRKW